MPRRSGSGKHKRSGSRSGGKRIPRNVYFGKDSIFKAVKDLGKRGVNTPRELKEIAAAQLADLKDLYTIDHDTGKKVKWSSKEGKKIWSGRTYVLWKLFYRLKAKGKMSKKEERDLAKFLKTVGKSGHIIMNLKSSKARTERIKSVLKKAGFSDKQINELLRATN